MDWVIRKRGYFYRPNRAGYTASIKDAGRYTEQDARAEAAIEPRSITAHPASEFEREYDPGVAPCNDAEFGMNP